MPGSGRRDADRTRPPAPRTDGYVPLRSYGAIGDGRTVALVAEDGRIDWFPVPALDTRPTFAALLDAEGGGRVEMAPTVPFEMAREYVPGTNVLVTRFVTDTGEVRLTDAMTTGVAGRLPWCELVRRVEGVRGSVPMAWRVAPGTMLGTASPWVRRTRRGPVLTVDGVSVVVTTLGEMTTHVADREVAGVLTTTPGSRHVLGLAGTAREPVFVPDPALMDAGVERTVENWRAWTREFHYDGPWAQAVQRSALALKLLVHAPTGAIAAAGTTALPESWDGGKNWDYRYAWVRDVAYVVDALTRFGLREETHAAMAWTLRTVAKHPPSVFFTLDGELAHGPADGEPGDGPAHRDVPGWRGIGPVVDGNRASRQLQLGTYGDLMGVVRTYVDAGNLLDAETGRVLAGIADHACDAWRKPDAGIWELTDEHRYTSSALGCRHALLCAAHLADEGHLPGDAQRWRGEAEAIAAWLRAECWSDARGAYVMHPGSEALDASVLLFVDQEFDTPERLAATLDAIRAELGSGPLLWRYSGMQEEEGTFVACAFWGVRAAALLGRVDEAREWMDELLAQANDVGIWSEMIDARTGEFLGNLPQALSHLALVHAALAVGGDQDAHVVDPEQAPYPLPDEPPSRPQTREDDRWTSAAPTAPRS
ncbi:glycoside hydrolase family 15 protein [Cellulomonas shaoxiangyii]|uniref:Glycoside hydrolase family 15 protein n=1 Tax=Cellulomonas shaoxiangyii TaxID=2566013 RepID=A0A4P7SQ64_9CELL|nr:glycoside hydrolase family 15 protein [Cellulomonas shaoxiangyii]TGY85129.1 glycoside hydrolase family 15 protein [Cellulomonas shaoxiangyii]